MVKELARSGEALERIKRRKPVFRSFESPSTHWMECPRRSVGYKHLSPLFAKLIAVALRESLMKSVELSLAGRRLKIGIRIHQLPGQPTANWRNRLIKFLPLVTP